MAFQNITPVKLGQAAIGVAASILYTVPTSRRTFVKDIDLSNTTAAAIAGVSVYLVPAGGSPSQANMLVPGITLPANSIFQWTGSQILNAQDTIQVQAVAPGVTINASGGEAT
jgi:hypothetical protein